MDDERVEHIGTVEPEDAGQAVLEGGVFGACIAVAPPGPGVCEVCCGARLRPLELCHSCRRVSRGLKRPLVPVTPISLTKRTSALYSALKHYKGRPNLLSRRQQLRLVSLIDTFVGLHGLCIAPDGFDVVAVVPSRQVPIGEHPLAATIAMVPTLASRLVHVLSVGPGCVAANSPCLDAYMCARELVEGRRLLLVDDTYTTGAHMQSAAAVLAGCGASSVDLLVIGRYQNPTWPPARRLLLWAARPENRWDPTSCVRCRVDEAGSHSESAESGERVALRPESVGERPRLREPTGVALRCGECSPGEALPRHPWRNQ